MEVYLEEDCTLTLSQLADKVFERFGVKLSTSTEPSTCNNDANKVKRFRFAKALIEHQDDGDYIVCFDETNSNVFCMRSL
ncbi:hypothetical protein L914_17529 [Phytophthora nicotianae]|uniref:Uncharacterized protein n=1 Tax=Phytophthora nicotianae TaxID=4792 RepID=W2MGX8_PHYNI|nr:hypothetical protein L914_17529 [Phytophthora nicotianae]